MSINITESDRLAYDCSVAQNSRLTLEEFTKNEARIPACSGQLLSMEPVFWEVNIQGVSELAKTDFCVFVPQTGQLALQVAAQINGVVVTSNPLEGSCEDFNLKLEWRTSKLGHRRTETSDYIPGKQFFFKNGYGEEMFEDEVISKVYTFPIQLQYGISKERRDMAYSDEKKDKILALLNQLIVDGLNKKNVVMPEGSSRESPDQSTQDEDEEEEDEW
ncbi:hypothetical protein CAEBREN_11993 [Caenorhabditis brenneri]|uniref:Uncharacterized protein n=1 Tax=Caenorhabditis brenneri TaxID=135651 RepID=G0N2P3_CAEBE|nr:hypothetical protein CAEBREN_11993 [Caenorhabditis brenneri]